MARLIETLQELIELRDTAVIRDATESVLEKWVSGETGREDEWVGQNYHDVFKLVESEVPLPATVLFEPEV